MARLLASKIEQSQKVLRTVAEGITPDMLNSPSSLEWLLQQGLPAVQFFDSMQVARHDGALRVNLHSGRLEDAANLDPSERDALRRTLTGGKPLVSELVAGRTAEARVMFTMPLRREDGSVMGVVAGALKLQSQGLLPPSMTLPARDDSRLIVFTRDGTILSHPDPLRILGNVRDETGLGPVYTGWLQQAQPVAGRGTTEVLPAHIVSMAGMPLPQWFVARVSDARAMLAPLEGAQRKAWWLAGSNRPRPARRWAATSSTLCCVERSNVVWRSWARPRRPCRSSSPRRIRRCRGRTWRRCETDSAITTIASIQLSCGRWHRWMCQQ